MTIYLDLVVFLNFLVDFLLLLGTNRLSGYPPSLGRCALAAALGALYSGICLLPGWRFMGNVLWRTVSLTAMALTAFGGNRSALRRGGVFLILSMALGGLALSFGRQDLPAIGLWAVVLWGLCHVAFGEGLRGREYVTITITYRDRSISVSALRDTGNTLTDPITGQQVLVLAGEAACRLTGLTMDQLRDPLKTLAEKPLPGLRLIPYRAVGGGGMLLAMGFEKVKLGNSERSALVAFAPDGLGQGQLVQALAGGII